jgi:RNA polymerase sigma-70 factor (ECF subfamily)
VGQSDPPAGPGLEAFNAVYQRELDYVWRTLGRLGVPEADLPDAAHDVFVVLYRRWSDVDPGLPVRPWLFGVARKVAAARRRARKPSDPMPEIVDDGTDERIASRDLLWRALAELDEARRVVVVLHDLEGHTGLEIANLLGISANTVHSRLRLARAELVEVIARMRGTP